MTNTELLQECKLQLEYLNEKFGETGTTNSLLSKLNQALHKPVVSGKLAYHQLCPKCFGEGQVSNIGNSSSVWRTCPVCNGAKTLRVDTCPPACANGAMDTVAEGMAFYCKEETPKGRPCYDQCSECSIIMRGGFAKGQP